jgi:hypothetical protein
MNTEQNKNTKINLVLDTEEVNFILQVLGDMPIKSGAFSLIMNIKAQGEPQVKQ